MTVETSAFRVGDQRRSPAAERSTGSVAAAQVDERLVQRQRLHQRRQRLEARASPGRWPRGRPRTDRPGTPRAGSVVGPRGAGIADRTPNTRASYDAVATTPRCPTPPTTTGLPRSDGLSRCSTEAKKASRSRWSTDASRRTRSLSVAATAAHTRQRTEPEGNQPRLPPTALRTALASRPFMVFMVRAVEPYSTVIAAPAWLALYQPVMVPWQLPLQLSDLSGSAARSRAAASGPCS